MATIPAQGLIPDTTLINTQATSLTDKWAFILQHDKNTFYRGQESVNPFGTTFNEYAVTFYWDEN